MPCSMAVPMGDVCRADVGMLTARRARRLTTRPPETALLQRLTYRVDGGALARQAAGGWNRRA